MTAEQGKHELDNGTNEGTVLTEVAQKKKD